MVERDRPQRKTTHSRLCINRSLAYTAARDGSGWLTAHGDALVCGETDLTVEGDPPACFPAETWEEARSICTGVGARLCTVEELEADETAGKNRNTIPALQTERPSKEKTEQCNRIEPGM